MGHLRVANSIATAASTGGGWDDSFSGYTGVCTVYHRAHTIEIPSQQSPTYAGRNAVLGELTSSAKIQTSFLKCASTSTYVARKIEGQKQNS